MGEDAARRLETGRHQKSRPIDRVEPHDILADDVKIGGPESRKLRAFGVRIAGRGEIIGQSVEPHIDHVVGVARDRNSPAEAGSRDRQVAQAALDKADDLVPPAARRDRIRVRVVKSQ